MICFRNSCILKGVYQSLLSKYNMYLIKKITIIRWIKKQICVLLLTFVILDFDSWFVICGMKLLSKCVIRKSNMFINAVVKLFTCFF